MLDTDKIYKDLKIKLVREGFLNLSPIDKVCLIEKKLKEITAKKIGVKNIDKYELPDMLEMLNMTMNSESEAQKTFTSYNNAITNLMSSIQGYGIVNDASVEKEPKILLNEYGYFDTFASSKLVDPVDNTIYLVNVLKNSFMQSNNKIMKNLKK